MMMMIVREVETHMCLWGPGKRYVQAPLNSESLIFYQIRKEKPSDEEKGLTAAAQEAKPRCCQTYDSWANVMKGLETKLFLGDGDKLWVGRVVKRRRVARKIKDKESTHGRNEGSGLTQGRTDESISGDGKVSFNAGRGFTTKKRGKVERKKERKNVFQEWTWNETIVKRPTNIRKLVTAAEVLKDEWRAPLRVNLEAFS